MARITGIRTRLIALLASAAVVAPACVISADLGRYVEREEKHFSTTGRPDVVLSTFDGSIEVHAWDEPGVQVVIEKHARDKADAARVEVRVAQNGNRIEIDAQRQRGGFALLFGRSRSAKLIVSMPADADLSATSGDGSIDVDGITGKLALRSGDGSIKGTSLGGDLAVHTGDGSIRLDGISGALDVETGDGSVTAAGTFNRLRAHSGDGSITCRVAPGSAAGADWDVSTGDGSVTLELPDSFAAELDAHTSDGRISLQDGLTLSDVTGRIGRNTVRGTLGAGGRTLRVRSGDGSIVLKKTGGAATAGPVHRS